MKYLKIILLLPVLVLVFIFSKKLYNSFSPGKNQQSANSTVSDVINILDNSFDKFGTFNKDHLPIFEALKKLQKSELQRLHKDFGAKFYNPVTRMYGVTNIGDFGISSPRDLNAIFDLEFDPGQIEQLKKIYNSKDLQFPYITK